MQDVSQAIPAIVLASVPVGACVVAKVIQSLPTKLPSPAKTQKKEEDAIESLLRLAGSSHTPPGSPVGRPQPAVPAIVKTELFKNNPSSKRVQLAVPVKPVVCERPAANRQFSFEHTCKFVQDQLPMEISRITQVVAAACQNRSREYVTRLLFSFFRDVFGFALETHPPQVVEEIICCPFPHLIGKVISHAMMVNSNNAYPNQGFQLSWEHAYAVCSNFNTWLRSLHVQGHHSSIPSWFEPFQNQDWAPTTTAPRSFLMGQ
jgi:hypothetical protein